MEITWEMKRLKDNILEASAILQKMREERGKLQERLWELQERKILERKKGMEIIKAYGFDSVKEFTEKTGITLSELIAGLKHIEGKK